jgi:hypothetical protein
LAGRQNSLATAGNLYKGKKARMKTLALQDKEFYNRLVTCLNKTEGLLILLKYAPCVGMERAYKLNSCR